MTDELKKALEARDAFLAQNPSLAPFQAMIDKELDRCGDDTLKRLLTIKGLLRFSNEDLLDSLDDLKVSYDNAKKILDELGLKK